MVATGVPKATLEYILGHKPFLFSPLGGKVSLDFAIMSDPAAFLTSEIPCV